MMSKFDNLVTYFKDVSKNNNQNMYRRIVPPSYDGIFWAIRGYLRLYYFENEEKFIQKPLIRYPDFKYDYYRKFIKFYSLPKFLSSTVELDHCPVNKFFLHLINIGILIRSMVMAYVLFGFSQAIDNRHPELRFGANKTQSCVLKSNIVELDRNIDRRYYLFKYWLKLIGFTMPSSTRLFCHSLNCLLVIALTLYIMAFFNRKQCFHLNWLSFHRNPVQERRRIKRKLVKIIQNLYKSADNAGHWWSDSAENSTSITKSSAYNFKHRALSFSSMHHASKEAEILSIRCSDAHSECTCAEERRERLKYVQFIFGERLFDMVKPSNLTNQFHARLTQLQDRIFFGYVFSLCSFLVFVAYVWMSGEVMSRVKARTNLIKCLDWNENATLMNDIFEFDQDPLLDNELNIYRQYMDGLSFIPTVRVYLIEIARINTIPFLELMVEHSLSYLIAYLWVSDYSWFFSQGCYFLLEWLTQIQEQLSCCVQLLEEHSINEPKLIDLDHETDEKITKQKRDIEKAMTVSYLNFELFRQEYKSFRRVTNFLIVHLIAIVLVNSLASYIMVESSSTAIPIIFAVNVAYILALNFFVAYCVTIIKRIQKIYKTMIVIVVKSSQAQMELTQVIKLWRRQALSDLEVTNSYSIQVFGGNFSQSTLIAFDSYVIAFWLAMSQA